MAKPSTDPPTTETAKDAKLDAFNAIVAAVKELEKAEQYAVLHAAAKYFSVSIALNGDGANR